MIISKKTSAAPLPPDLAEQVEAAALKPRGPARLVRKYSAYTLLAIDE